MKTTETVSQYEQQAQSFLDRFGIKFRATLSDSKPCPWHDPLKPRAGQGHHYRITLSKAKASQSWPGVELGAFPKRLTFDFWSSIHDAERGILTVTPYDVLACISGDVNCADSFEDFCAVFGWNEDSINALQTFRRCSAFSNRLKSFFTTAEIEALQEIK